MPHSREQMDLIHTRRGNALIVAAIAAVFVALRVVLLFAREPFFDELFTVWLVKKPFGAIVAALRHDSGPPLYYFVVHALGLRSVETIRILSIVASIGALFVVVSARSLGTARFVAAALLAVYPASVLFAVDARAYAFAALFVAIGLVLLWNDRLFAAALVFVVAGYSHYYGALFLPLVLVPFPRLREGSPVLSLSRRAMAFACGAILLLPAVALAISQPREAMQWLNESRWKFATSIPFAGDYPYGLFASSPTWLVAIASVVLVVCLAVPAVLRRIDRLYRFAAAATIVPLVLAVAAGVYFPLRFDSMIAVPLALWIAASAVSMPPLMQRTSVAFFFFVGLATAYSGIVDHARRPVDAYRDAATWTAQHVAPQQKVVASGYCYLEAVSAMRNDVVAFPAAQALHPGWRAFPQTAELPPATPFVWIGERGAPELQILRRTSSIRPVYANRNAIVAFVR